MKSKKLYIPDELLVGFQKRSDTMTGLLSYITYKKSNRIYKETSWKGWIDDNIKTTQPKNLPTSGFLVSKDIERISYSYYSRGSVRSKMRIYDPRGFDFEISIPNLCYIIETCNLNNGEIEGEFVYAWDGNELILLPTKTIEYKESKTFSNNENKKISARELVVGATYQTKKIEEHVVYIGRYDFYSNLNYKKERELIDEMRDQGFVVRDRTRSYPKKYDGKKHVFFNLHSGLYEAGIQNKLSIVLDNEIHEKFDTLLADFIESSKHSPIIGYNIDDNAITSEYIKEHGDQYPFVIDLNNGNYLHFDISYFKHDDTFCIRTFNMVQFNEEFKVFIPSQAKSSLGQSFYYNSGDAFRDVFNFMKKDREGFIQLVEELDYNKFKEYLKDPKLNNIMFVYLFKDNLDCLETFYDKEYFETYSARITAKHIDDLLSMSKVKYANFVLKNKCKEPVHFK